TAFRHRDRLTEMERLLTEGYYYTNGPDPDHGRALLAYDEAVRLDTLNTSALNNSAGIYGVRREYDRAREMYLRVTRLPRTFSGAFTNLLIEQVRSGRPVAEMESTRAEFAARFPESAQLWIADWTVARARGDHRVADSIALAASTRSSLQDVMRATDYLETSLVRQGRFREAQGWGTRMGNAWQRAQGGVAALQWMIMDSAYISGLGGDPARGRAQLARALERYPMDSMAPEERGWGFVSDLAFALDDPDMARKA